MAIKVFELYGDVELRDAKLKTGLRSANKGFDDFERNAKAKIKGVEGSFAGMGASMGNFLSRTASNVAGNLITGGMNKIVEQMKDVTTRGMELSDMVQKARLGYGQALGSDEKAVALIKELVDLGNKTQFKTGDVLHYGQQLLSVGIQATEVTQALRDLGDAAASTGNFDKFERALVGITQMLSKGKVSMEEMRQQLSEAIPGSQGMMARGLGISESEMIKLMGEGRINAGPAVRLMLMQMRKERGGFLDKTADTTFESLQSRKMDAEAVAMMLSLHGGDMFNVLPDSARAKRIELMKHQITRREGLAGGNASNAFGKIASAYFGLVDKDEELLFADSEIKDFFLDLGANVASKPGSGPGGLFGPDDVGKGIGDKIKPGWKGLDEYLPFLKYLNPSWEDLGIGGSDKPKGATGMFKNAVGTSIDAVEKGAGPMEQAGNVLASALEKGIDSIWQFGSPSKKAIQLGQWINEGLEIGLGQKGSNYSALLSGVMAMHGGGFAGVSQRQYLEQVGQDPTVRAFFEAIKKAEGGAPDIMAGGRRTGRLDVHPGEVVPMSQWFRGDKGPSSAAGNWQITRTNWRRLAPELGLTDFSEHSQYIAALKLFSDRQGGAGLRALLSGDISTAMKIAAMDWTSTPGSTIGGGKQLSKNRWMNFFNTARESGGSPVASGAAVSESNPLPVVVVSVPGAEGLNWQKWKPSTFGGPDINNSASIFGSGVQQTQTKAQTARTITDKVPVNVDVLITKAEKPLETFGVMLTENALNLKKLADVTKEAAAVTDDEVAKLRKEAIEGSTKKKKRDPLFDPAFTREGIAGDFHGGLSSLLGNLGWGGSAKDLGKQFLFNLARDAQGRIAHDLSSMITGSIFGGRGEDGKLTGGLFGGKGFNLGSIFSKLFGGLFGGFRASGGSMSPGRFYVAGENGPELITGPGYVHNNRETRQMMGGGDPNYTIVAIGDREIGRAVDAYRSSPRGRRARMIQAKYMRLITAHA